MPAQTSGWNIESQRLSLFRVAGVEIDAAENWKAIGGGTPEEVNFKPATRTHTVIGPFGAGRLLLQVDPSRIDCLMLPANPEEPASTSPVLGPYPELFQFWQQSIKPWIKRAPEAVRIASGLVLTYPADSRRHGYSLLAQWLRSIQIDEENSSDFLYQINRPRPSGVVAGMSINRLSKWAVQRIVFAPLTVGANGLQLTGSELVENYQCRLELDLSSPQERGTPLPTELLPDLVEELFHLAGEIVAEGDLR